MILDRIMRLRCLKSLLYYVTILNGKPETGLTLNELIKYSENFEKCVNFFHWGIFGLHNQVTHMAIMNTKHQHKDL